ncbi:MAG: DNA (cytosine-5-)-methyltransferase [Gemmatimonadetes bacterium]|nr:DNA (cytosine-5-)-methyltransferase [Gemmatimonadota bacterium]
MSVRTNTKIAKPYALRALRESLGLTQEELAVRAGYSARQIARWESPTGRVREAVFQYLLSLRPATPSTENCSFSFIDLFAGIGGFRRGFEAAGGRCVFTSEWDKYAQKTYTANFGDEGVFGDITKVKESEIPDHDILLAGFPCQPFSIAGVSKKNSLGRKHGFECETQGTLFFDIERIIAAKRPKAFVLENVKNLASHDKGKTFEVIRRTLAEKLGYRISVRIVDAASFVPQHRERVFIVGIRPDIGEAFDWETVDIPAPKFGPRLKTILHPEDGSEDPEERFLDPKGRVLSKYVLTDHLWAYLQGYAAKHQAAGNGFGFGLVGPEDVARTLSARYYKDGSEILVRRKKGNPRRLTPRECARLMGFDRPGSKPFRIVVSDTQAYKQFGNSVSVPVVEAIAKALAPRVIEVKNPVKKRASSAA